MAEHRKAKAKQWLDETFPETPPLRWTRNLRSPSPRRRARIRTEALPLRRPPRPRRTCPPPIPCWTTSTRTTHPRLRRRGPRRAVAGRSERGEGAVMASRSRPGRPGTPPGRRTTVPGDGRTTRTTRDAAVRAGARFWSGSCSSSASPCISRWTSPSCSRRPSRAGRRRFGVADHARRRRAADASKPAEAPPRRVGGGEEDDEFRSARRGTAGARQRALDRADVPPELRGHVSAARWKQELRAFHEEQVRLAAAQRRVAGEAAPDAASARRKKARERATEHARREVR